MSTTTTTPAPFNFASIVPLLELAANTTLTVLGTTGVVPGGASIASLAAAIESSVNPLISTLSTGGPATADVMAAYGSLIGVLNTLRKQSGLPQDVLAKIDEYIAAAQDGTSAYLAAGSAYSASLLTPVTPIVVPAAAQKIAAAGPGGGDPPPPPAAVAPTVAPAPAAG